MRSSQLTTPRAGGGGGGVAVGAGGGIGCVGGGRSGGAGGVGAGVAGVGVCLSYLLEVRVCRLLYLHTCLYARGGFVFSCCSLSQSVVMFST